MQGREVLKAATKQQKGQNLFFGEFGDRGEADLGVIGAAFNLDTGGDVLTLAAGHNPQEGNKIAFKLHKRHVLVKAFPPNVEPPGDEMEGCPLYTFEPAEQSTDIGVHGGVMI